MKSVLCITPSKNYFKSVCSVINQEVGSQHLIYVTTNRPFTHLKSTLKDAKISTRKTFFIDCISKRVGKVKNEPNCLFLDGPEEVTGLSLAIYEAAGTIPGKKVAIIDSLSTLLIYNSEDVVGRFSNFLINKMRPLGVSTILICLNSDADRRIIKAIESFVDETISYEGATKKVGEV